MTTTTTDPTTDTMTTTTDPTTDPKTPLVDAVLSDPNADLRRLTTLVVNYLGQVHNGGHEQYFHNGYGDELAELSDGLGDGLGGLADDEFADLEEIVGLVQVRRGLRGRRAAWDDLDKRVLEGRHIEALEAYLARHWVEPSPLRVEIPREIADSIAELPDGWWVREINSRGYSAQHEDYSAEVDVEVRGDGTAEFRTLGRSYQRWATALAALDADVAMGVAALS